MPSVTGAVFAIRGSVLDPRCRNNIGYLDEGYKLGCEDTEFCLRAGVSGHEVWYVSDSVVMHHDNAVRKTNPQDRERIQEWARLSDEKFRREWGPFVDNCATGEVAFVLPDFNPVAGGCRVVAALANAFIIAGKEATIYTDSGKSHGGDIDLPQLFNIKPLSELKEADILIATRFDTVKKTKHIKARRKFYLVQQIETCMAKYCGATEEDVLWSYRQSEYEIITIGEHLAKQLHDMGRTCKVLDVGLYRNLYQPLLTREDSADRPFRVLMYASPADYKGGGDLAQIAAAIRERLGDRIVVNSFHRDFERPSWADEHFRPQSTSEVAKVYADHDVYVYASHSDGFAMTPVEAMACGTTVILTDFPGKDQYARNGDNCIVVPFRDFKEIAATVDELSKRPALCEWIRQYGYTTASRYDWSVVARQYIREILESPK
jgi:glycosyltransferase involved in cell wall biosynthesis